MLVVADGVSFDRLTPTKPLCDGSLHFPIHFVRMHLRIGACTPTCMCALFIFLPLKRQLLFFLKPFAPADLISISMAARSGGRCLAVAHANPKF